MHEVTTEVLADLDDVGITFSAAGGIPGTKNTFNGYSSIIIGFVATTSVNFTSNAASAETGLEGLRELFQKSAGVNTDDELAQIIELENNYRASAKIINTIQKMLELLTTSIG